MYLPINLRVKVRAKVNFKPIDTQPNHANFTILG